MKPSRFVLTGSLLLLTGCLSPWGSLLDRAERLVGQGDYPGAVQTYDEFLARYPDDPAAPRVLATRNSVASLLAARADITRLREDLAAREAELGRLRQELERLRADLENLKRIDLREERRRR